MLRITKWGFIYFAIVFGVGFALGLVRVPLVEPWLGVRWAELTEMPLMLVAIILTANVVVHKVGDATGIKLLGIGAVALTMLLVTEFTFVLTLRGLSVTEYVKSRDSVSGTVYLLMLSLFMFMPWLIRMTRSGSRHQNQKSPNDSG